MTPTERTIRYFLGGAFHRLAYTDWGDPSAPIVVCVHGLNRNGRDFDPMGETLARRFRVICPDLPGRGASDWLPDPTFYQTPHYLPVLGHLLAALDAPVAWVGTSLGGICGLLLAAAAGSPVTRLILNDIGPFLAAEPLGRIHHYMVSAADSPFMRRFPDLDAIERHLRLVHAPFGPLTDAQWQHLARVSARSLPTGRLTMHYDPAIADPMRRAPAEPIDLWAHWARLHIPVLAIRGAQSEVLAPETFARMRADGAETLEIAEAGHAPALMDPAQIDAVGRFLAA